MGTFDPIFEPVKIGQLELKNRIAMAPMNMNYTGPNGYISDQQMAYYAARAKGGTALIVTESVYGTDHPTSQTYRKFNNPSIANELYVPRMSELVEHVHSFGGKIFCQLVLGPGRQGNSDAGAIQPVSASPIPYITYPEYIINGMPDNPFMVARAAGYQGELPETTDIDEMLVFMSKIPGNHIYGETPREIAVEEIEELLEDLKVASKLTRRCGFDGIEFHATHGYLIHSFFSKRSNKRTDRYGGSFENRIRFLLQAIQAIRQGVGPDYPVGFRMSASEELHEGFDPHFTNRVAKRAEEEGADFIHLSDGSYEKLDDFIPNNDGQVVPKSAIIKEGLNIPVICPSVHKPEDAAAALKNGHADLISQGRQLIADPEWVNKVRDGRLDEIIKCNRCNLGCITRFFLSLPCRCIKNPVVGREMYVDEYWRRPLLGKKDRAWQIMKEWSSEPSTPVKGLREEILDKM
ncbi:MAG: NADH:flavin oxidoreductase [Proteobacteria bacterium]|nr:NADH:flavin oxidoreductase [Pseudomonadota bacterium]